MYWLSYESSPIELPSLPSHEKRDFGTIGESQWSATSMYLSGSPALTTLHSNTSTDSRIWMSCSSDSGYWLPPTGSEYS